MAPPAAEAWDAIVIGSGIGGLTAASLLAKLAKKRVLVLEKHSERGGLTHVFRRDGASWDVGVHYVGGLQPGSRVRGLFDFMSDGALEWTKMTDDFERFVYPGLDFAVPSDATRYERRLAERFPAEAAALRRYFADLAEVFSCASQPLLALTLRRAPEAREADQGRVAFPRPADADHRVPQGTGSARCRRRSPGRSRRSWAAGAKAAPRRPR